MKNRIPLFFTAIIISLWILSLVLVFTINVSWADKGSFGDAFGVVNSLFSGLALVAVIYTLYKQQQDIAENKKEQELNHFENKYFQLIKIQNDIIQGIAQYEDLGQNKKELLSGRLRLNYLATRFLGMYKCRNQNNAHEDLLIIESTFNEFYIKYEHELSHYFRHFYHILSFIDKSNLNSDHKNHYSKLLRASLSTNELVLLFYDCLSSKGNSKLKPLVEKYAFFEHLPISVSKADRKLFSADAFREI